MALRIQPRESRRQAETARGISHQLSVFVAHHPGSMPAMILQKFTERQNAIFPQQQTHPTVILNRTTGMTVARPLIGLLNDTQGQTAWCRARLGVISHSRFACQVGSDDPRCCRGGMIAVAFFVDMVGRRQFLHFVTKDPEKITADSIRGVSTPCKSIFVGLRKKL